MADFQGHVPGRLIPARAGKTGARPQPRRPPRAHPRACGENDGLSELPTARTGSSPRVRGKPRRRNREPEHRGLIPARAGKTTSNRTGSASPGAHPRACGENLVTVPRQSGKTGSSPRVRGKLCLSLWGVGLARLIPARAGKTAARARHQMIRAAHPRACGENTWSPRILSANLGSSPRVRGKPRNSTRPSWTLGLIPARAGKTTANQPVANRGWAHPRACGENATWSLTSTPTLGSSPRVRGKPQGRYAYPSPSRLIPARAGKTWCSQRSAWCTRAHPRACGENVVAGIVLFRWLGSSPRVRGKRREGAALAAVARLIPARAGKTPCGHEFAPSFPAHPRACGENRSGSTRLRSDQGSSPRVRGKRSNLPDSEFMPRLIPARAGKTMESASDPPWLGAHPRACGENGTSRVAATVLPRLIPARAGKTVGATPCPPGTSAHPRACGENATAAWTGVQAAGSSPRVRGKRGVSGMGARPRRLIPARAGKTVRLPHRRYRRRAHPRACGENTLRTLAQASGPGSSPRVRGKHELARISDALGRLIPARAGKTSSSSSSPFQARAHPRACGEN